MVWSSIAQNWLTLASIGSRFWMTVDTLPNGAFSSHRLPSLPHTTIWLALNGWNAGRQILLPPT